MLDSSEGISVSATQASKLAPQPLQNWVSDGLARPQPEQGILSASNFQNWHCSPGRSLYGRDNTLATSRPDKRFFK